MLRYCHGPACWQTDIKIRSQDDGAGRRRAHQPPETAPAVVSVCRERY
ncbi:hypothetical protein HTIA_2548 [Halorhabdus tiamatea SARL4B]|uniref:Uncharacterized protein n=1 Tax=Halorhabdus tiamatea SARL4B TaxID=1033806 RepID=S6CUS6_9EURY|nr:hypothetical protein HTIA_2548 [Halorhabdus tiamatea SARL4B]